jgi:putative peptidoglycan lipid II flippase
LKPPQEQPPAKSLSNFEKAAAENRKSSVILKALMMAAGTFSSRILGLIREMALAAFFDRTVTDAWTAAFRLPNLFRRLLGEGSLSVSLQPILIHAQIDDEKNGGRKAQSLMDSMHLLLIVALTVLTLAGILFSGPVLNLILDTSYVQNTAAFALTVRLAQIMFGFLFFICLFAYYMAILNSVGSFGWPAAAPVLFNVSLIISTLIPAGWLPVRGDTLAWGVLFGGFFQMAILFYPLKQRRLLPGFKWNPRNPDVLKVLQNMVPGLIGLGLMQMTLLINTHFASSLGAGAISYIYWADRLLELPLSLISVSLGTALLPTLAEYWVRGEKEKTAEVSERYLSLNLFVGSMASVALYVLALPMVKILFERGHFSSEDSIAVASVLQVYSLTLIPVSAVRVLAPAYYAVKNTWFPAVSSGVALVIHVIIAPRLMDAYGLRGLNFSSFVSAGVNILFLLSFYSFFISTFPWGRFAFKILKTMVAAAVMIFICQYVIDHMALSQNTLGWILSFLMSSGLGVSGYLLTSFILKHPDMYSFVETVLKRLKRRKPSN